MDRRTFLATAALPASLSAARRRPDQAHRGDDSRRRVPHQRAADICRPDLQWQAHRRAADERPGRPGHLRRPQRRDGAAMGVSRHEALGSRIATPAEFIAAMAEWKRHGVLGFTINLQGGSPGFRRRTRTRCRPGRSRSGAPMRRGRAVPGNAAARREGRRRRAAGGRRPRRADEALRVRNRRTPRSIPTGICGRPTWPGCSGSSTRPTNWGWWRSSATSTSGRTSG